MVHVHTLLQQHENTKHTEPLYVCQGLLRDNSTSDFDFMEQWLLVEQEICYETILNLCVLIDFTLFVI